MRIWVADTCALIEVRRYVTVPNRKEVFKELGNLVAQKRLFYPQEVFNELKRNKSNKSYDHAYEFAHKHRDTACRETNIDHLKEIASHRLVCKVLDPSRETEEADMYVLSMAVELQQEGNDVGVLTQERRDCGGKLSVNTACGILGLVCLPMPAFLDQEDIYMADAGEVPWP